MATTIIVFQDRRSNAHEPSSRRQDIHSARRNEDVSLSSQTQAHRIVAQIEREITNRAYQRAQLRLKSPAAVQQMRPPNGIAERIFHAIRSLARSA